MVTQITRFGRGLVVGALVLTMGGCAATDVALVCELVKIGATIVQECAEN